MKLGAAAQSGILGPGSAMPTRRGVATPVATSILSTVSSPSTEPRNLDDSDAPRSIYAPRIGLRALWTEWSVEVRVLSGALEKPRVWRAAWLARPAVTPPCRLCVPARLLAGIVVPIHRCPTDALLFP